MKNRRKEIDTIFHSVLIDRTKISNFLLDLSSIIYAIFFSYISPLISRDIVSKVDEFKSNLLMILREITGKLEETFHCKMKIQKFVVRRVSFYYNTMNKT